MRLKRVVLIGGLAFAAGAATLGFDSYGIGHTSSTARWVQEMQLKHYEQQKVIYHVDEGAGLLNGRFKHVLQIAQNHLDAVGRDKLDLRIIMQSEGVDLLVFAKHNENARDAVGKLKAQGVRFEVCRNTLIQRGIDPDKDLYDVKPSDVIRAAVSEIAALEQHGFQYIKP